MPTESELLVRIEELETVCAELYQVIGTLAGAHVDLFDHPAVIKALDNASEARLVHKDLLPFIVPGLEEYKETKDAN